MVCPLEAGLNRDATDASLSYPRHKHPSRAAGSCSGQYLLIPAPAKLACWG